jgi:hypothetical protein
MKKATLLLALLLALIGLSASGCTLGPWGPRALQRLRQVTRSYCTIAWTP